MEFLFYSFVDYFNKYLLRTSQVPSTVLGIYREEKRSVPCWAPQSKREERK